MTWRHDGHKLRLIPFTPSFKGTFQLDFNSTSSLLPLLQASPRGRATWRPVLAAEAAERLGFSSSSVQVQFKFSSSSERVLPDTTQSDEKLVLTVASSHMVVDQPPRADRRRACDDSSWDLLLYLVRPPPPPLTAEELAAQKAMLLEQKQRVRERNARFFQA